MKSISLPWMLPAAVAAIGAQESCTLTATISAKTTFSAQTVSTYCPECDVARASGGVYTTRYDTTLLVVGPSGLVSSVFPVTNVLTGTTPIDQNAIPPGFTTTALVCTACPSASTVVDTTPIGGNDSEVAATPTAGASGLPSIPAGTGGTGAAASPSDAKSGSAGSSTFVTPPAQDTGAATALKALRDSDIGGFLYLSLAAIYYALI